METYAALLRGINVSGQKSILMEDLKRLCAGLKWEGARTYIQSGNVVFKSPRKKPELTAALEKAILKQYAFDVRVIVRSVGELEAALQANPFGKLKLAGKERVHVTFLAEAPDRAAVKKLEAHNGEADQFRVRGTEVYILTRDGYGKTVFSNAFMEKKLGVASTTRNLQTVGKLVELGGLI